MHAKHPQEISRHASCMSLYQPFLLEIDYVFGKIAQKYYFILGITNRCYLFLVVLLGAILDIYALMLTKF